jgi:hypothetical protein
MKIQSLILLPVLLILSACQLPQIEASATYIGAEAATAALLQKQPQALLPLQSLVADWHKYQLGTLTTSDEAVLLQQITTATKAKLDPVAAATLDGAVQQILANVNTTAPTPLGGAAAAIITDLMNGVARELTVYVPPSSTAATSP